MKKFRIGLLITSITFLTFCQSRYFVDFSKITFNDVKLKKTERSDSLKLTFTLKIPPKSVGKKGMAVILPMIINESDTLKFKTLTLAGEGNWDDCMNIPYKHPTVREYQSSEKVLSKMPHKLDIIFSTVLTTKKNEITKQEFLRTALDNIQINKD